MLVHVFDRNLDESLPSQVLPFILAHGIKKKGCLQVGR